MHIYRYRDTVNMVRGNTKLNKSGFMHGNIYECLGFRSVSFSVPRHDRVKFVLELVLKSSSLGSGISMSRYRDIQV